MIHIGHISTIKELSVKYNVIIYKTTENNYGIYKYRIYSKDLKRNILELWYTQDDTKEEILFHLEHEIIDKLKDFAIL